MCVWCVMQGRCQNKKKNVFFEFGISAQGGAAQQKFFNKFCVCVCVGLGFGSPLALFMPHFALPFECSASASPFFIISISFSTSLVSSYLTLLLTRLAQLCIKTISIYYIKKRKK